MAVDALSFLPGSFVADILAGTSTEDVSGYLNGALANVGTIAMPRTGQMSIGSSLVVPSGGGIVGENYGCALKALPNFGDNPLIRNANHRPSTAAARDRNLVLSGIRLDGNKGQNATATEFSHGVQLYAVDGATIDLHVIDPKGDGLSIQQAVDAQAVGCSNIRGKVRTSGCRRQGVAIVCGEQIDLDVYDSGTNLMSVDIEPDHPENFLRNIFIRLLSSGTGNGSDISGGVCVAGDGRGCRPTNVMVDFEIFAAGGQGAIWRDAIGLILRGTIFQAAQNGLVGIAGGAGPSKVTFDGVRVLGTGSQGLSARETVGSFYDGQVSVENATSLGANIENARGGVLCLQIRNCGQQGLVLNNTHDMTFSSPTIESNNGHNVWLLGGSRGNRFQFLKSTGSNFGFGFLEASGCNDNRAFFARVSGNSGGNVSVSGAQSQVQLEPDRPQA